MTSEHRTIARVACWTRWLVAVVIASTVLLQILGFAAGSQHVRVHGLVSGPVGTGVGLAHSLFMVLALAQLFLLLRHLERGEIFSAGVTRRLRRFSVFTLLAVFTGGVLLPLLSLVLPVCEGGPCVRRIPLDMRGAWSLVSSIIFYLVAFIIDEARQIDEDNRQII